MTLIVDYTSLQAAAIEYLARDQDTTIIARVPTFIQFFEAKVNRSLFVRQMEQRSTALIDTTVSEPQYLALPTDFQSMRSIKITSTSPDVRLDYRSKAEMDEFRTSIDDSVDQPLYFTIFNNEIELCPTPDADYTIEMIYRQNIPALSSNSTNWLLTLAPDAYLYGTLLESAPYIKEDERIQTWALGLKTAFDDLNSLSQQALDNAGPLQMRITGVTP